MRADRREWLIRLTLFVLSGTAAAVVEVMIREVMTHGW